MTSRVRAVGCALVGAALAVTAIVGSGGEPATAQPTRVQATPLTNTPPTVTGYGQVAAPAATEPGPLPSSAAATRTLVPAAPRARSAAGASAVSGAASATATAATSTRKVALRALVVGVDESDFGLDTWKRTLDRVGAEYDVVMSASTPITAESLVGPDGTGRYNAILLTSAALLHQDATGAWVTPSAASWSALWTYEREFAVRQVALYASYGEGPEDYCLRAGSEGGLGDTTLKATLTAQGSAVFDHLKAGASIPLTQSWVYRDTLAADCGGVPLLTGPAGEILGVASIAADGRERIALTFSSNQYLLQSDLLVYGLFRWASRGLFLGEQRHFLKLDVDDYFSTSDLRAADGVVTPAGFRMRARDTYSFAQTQRSVKSRYPLASGFRTTMAFNGVGADLFSVAWCWPTGGVSLLTATSLCLRSDYEWINHTYSHQALNSTNYATTYSEINNNRIIGTWLGLSMNPRVLKTGEYSGLGVYHDDPDETVLPPTDHGLAASNPNLVTASNALGVTYLHGNMSFASHQPTCFNCSLQHPLSSAPLYVVPDWPTNLAYFSATPASATSFYNSFYGPNGLFPYWSTDQTYEQLLGHETDIALAHLAAGSAYTHTMHIPNMYDYGSGRSLAGDWLESVVSAYSTYYSVPLLSPTWVATAQYTVARNTHFAGKAAVTAVYDPATARVTLSSPAATTVLISGVTVGTTSAYGSTPVSTVPLTAGVTRTGTVSLRP